MPRPRVELVGIALALVVGCSSEDGPGGASESSASGSGGSLQNTSGTVGQPSGGAAIGGVATSSSGSGGAGLPVGGSTAGNDMGAGGKNMGAGGSSGMSAGGGVGMSGGGRANGGAASGGNGGRAASGGAGGASGAGGGTGACVKNLACKLSPPASTGDLKQDCVDRINQFLTQCACLPALTRRMDGEACADQMAEYDAGQNTAHAGFTAKICQPSGSQNECPGYSSNSQVIGLCMQQMWDEGPPPTATCTGTCYEDHGHFINMTDASVTKVACGFYTTAAGKVWAVQNFSR